MRRKSWAMRKENPVFHFIFDITRPILLTAIITFFFIFRLILLLINSIFLSALDQTFSSTLLSTVLWIYLTYSIFSMVIASSLIKFLFSYLLLLFRNLFFSFCKSTRIFLQLQLKLSVYFCLALHLKLVHSIHFSYDTLSLISYCFLFPAWLFS